MLSISDYKNKNEKFEPMSRWATKDSVLLVLKVKDQSPKQSAKKH